MSKGASSEADNNLLKDIVSCLTYEYCEAGKRVFDYGKIYCLLTQLGSHGDKFYIILDGQVSVQVPQTTQMVSLSSAANESTFLTGSGGTSIHHR